MQGERSNEEKLQLEARIKVKIMSVNCVAMDDLKGGKCVLLTQQPLEIRGACIHRLHNEQCVITTCTSTPTLEELGRDILS